MLIDAHTHLDEYSEYENGAELEKEALEQIEDNRILSIANAMDVPSYEKILKMAKKSSLILPCFGVHPRKAHIYSERLEELEEYAESCKMIGEIGLDYFWADKSTFAQQMVVFEYFLEKARALDKIINVHTKGAEMDIIEKIRKHKANRVIIHWYSGPKWEFRELVKMGCYFTVGVQLKYSEIISDIARAIPLDRLLLETDNPSGEEWLSKRIGMPRDIKNVYDDTAKLRKMSIGELETIAWNNYLRI
ncbi:MAG: TatD family hydrolase [Clostridiaceae bacterium]